MGDIVDDLRAAQLAVFGQGNFGEDDLGFFETDLGERAVAEIEMLRKENRRLRQQNENFKLEIARMAEAKVKE